MLIYPSYLICLALVLPALGLGAIILLLTIIASGPGEGFVGLLKILAFFGEAIDQPLRCGWRIAALLLTVGFFLGAGAIPALRTVAFQGLALLATICIAFCIFEASKIDRYNVINVLIVLSPSFFGIAACVWFAIKFKS